MGGERKCERATPSIVRGVGEGRLSIVRGVGERLPLQ